MAFLLALLLSFVPALLCASLVYWLDRYEKEPRILLVAFGWGAVVPSSERSWRRCSSKAR